MTIRKLCALLTAILLPIFSKAQVLPVEGGNLNYRLIGFSVPKIDGAIKYSFEIATGNCNTEKPFRKNIVHTIVQDSSKLITVVPYFGKSYTWRVVYKNKNKIVDKTPFYHFSTLSCPDVDTALLRLRVVESAKKYQDAYVFLDDNKALYDMTGQPVWFMTKVNGIPIIPRDLKMTRHGSITFLFDPPYEIDYNCNVLFKAPATGMVSKDYSEHFHHQFTRLDNGHYMALGEDSVSWGGNGAIAQADTSARKMQFGTLIEYDEQGNVVWSWRSDKYFTASDIRCLLSPNSKKYADVHENAFYFDDKTNYIYVSFRNIDRIVKIKYPEGTVSAAYGMPDTLSRVAANRNLFCGQHACKHSDHGYIYLFDNNSCAINGLPKVEKLTEPADTNAGLKVIWEYQCTIDGVDPNAVQGYNFISGGNVLEMPDRSLFVCMSGGSYCKTFIVNPDKKILWSAIPERWDPTTKKWGIVSEYRANIVYKKDYLERLIWNGEMHALQAKSADGK